MRCLGREEGRQRRGVVEVGSALPPTAVMHRRAELLIQSTPPFTACARSRFEVFGPRGWEGEGGAGGERGMSGRCGALDVA